jgi:hypothetical protein
LAPLRAKKTPQSIKIGQSYCIRFLFNKQLLKMAIDDLRDIPLSKIKNFALLKNGTNQGQVRLFFIVIMAGRPVRRPHK